MKATAVINSQPVAVEIRRGTNSLYVAVAPTGYAGGGDTIEEACDQVTEAHRRTA